MKKPREADLTGLWAAWWPRAHSKERPQAACRAVLKWTRPLDTPSLTPAQKLGNGSIQAVPHSAALSHRPLPFQEVPASVEQARSLASWPRYAGRALRQTACTRSRAMSDRRLSCCGRGSPNTISHPTLGRHPSAAQRYAATSASSADTPCSGCRTGPPPRRPCSRRPHPATLRGRTARSSRGRRPWPCTWRRADNIHAEHASFRSRKPRIAFVRLLLVA